MSSKILKNIWSIGILFLFLTLFLVHSSHAQQRKRLDLEDLDVKGELLNDGRLNLIGRQRLTLKNYVKFRTDYRKEIIEELPEPVAKQPK